MHKLRGILLVILGAASYGVLATFVKKANLEGYPTSGLNFLQYLIGFISLVGMVLLSRRNKNKPEITESKGIRSLIFFGTASGLTSYFYYYSIQFIPVSMAIVLLMQAIWMGVVLEFILLKKFDLLKFLGSILVIIGTLFAVNIFDPGGEMNWKGLTYGILASIAYTITLYASNTVSLHLPNLIRSKYIILGALLIVIGVWNIQLFKMVDFSDINLWKYGAFLGFFGAILPPIAFNKGFPLTGIGLGSILTSIEIPVSIFTASLILKEEVLNIQWFGVAVIILAVALINFKRIKTNDA